MDKKIIVKDIRLHNPARRRLLVAKQYLVQFSVGDTQRSTKQAREKKNSTSWDEMFYFDGDDGSVLLAKVYRKQHVGQDKFVGSLSDTIAGILGRLNDGVLEGPLGKYTPDGQIRSSGTTIKFALNVETRGTMVADELQASDATKKASEIVSALSTTVLVADLADSAITTTTNVANELQAFENTWGILLQRMAIFNKIVAGIASIHPYTLLAWSVISATNQLLVDQKNRDDRVIRLAGIMSDVLAFVEEAEPLRVVEAHSEAVKLLIQQITECGYFIAEYAKQNNFWTRTAKYTFSQVDSKITDYEDKLRDLKAAFLDGLSLKSGVTVFRMMNVAQAIAESVDLNGMPYADGARYVQEKACLPGTREAIIQEICDILNNPDDDSPRICLLTGVAGSGKSAVAHSIARLYDEQKRLGSSYCFLRSDVVKRNPQNFFSTIACNLSDHDPQYKLELWQVVKDNRSLRMSTSISEQIQRLIIEPGKNLHTIGPLIVVVDALDESEDPPNRRDLLRAFAEQIFENNLPTNLRFLITSRPESDILAALPPGPRIIHKQMGDIPQNVVDGDITKFILHSLRLEYTELESAWPNQEWCRLLVHHSQRLFQWASTASKFIMGDGAIGLNVRERLDILLHSKNRTGVHPLDDLYRTILGQLFSENAQDKFRSVMAVVLALEEPLSLTSLTTLFDGDPKIRDIIKPLGSLLDGVIDEEKLIRPLHTSFRDFLLDDVRSLIFHVDLLPSHFLCLGRAMLASMQKMLKFNICDLKDSRLRNSGVPNLTSQVAKAIPPHLAYSCQYWMDHIQHVDSTPELLDEISFFFKHFFPFWIEAISLLSIFSPISYVLAALKTCNLLEHWAKGHEIANLASEAAQFIQLFSPVIRESTPHLYLSAIPQTPSGSSLCQLWANHLQNQLSVTLGHPNSWPAEIHTLQGHTDDVLCVAYSPDGSHIASGSDKTIRVWDSITGQCVAGPFQTHPGTVASIVYSPDGSHIASGLRDHTIKVWDANTGQCVGDPFQGHTRPVLSVAYSSDGNHIASGSCDNTIRIWDATYAGTGKCVAGPFEGHTDAVESIAYSPDGSQIVSGSGDRTLRIWKARTGECVAGPFEGHGGTIFSVAYSPDGIHIVSGSWDRTVRIWHAHTGQCVQGPLMHTDWVHSVAYSPDGTCVVSGSADRTIIIWDVSTGKCVRGPFKGHTGLITSVAYSPDGNHIISGAWDKTIRVWNANTGHHVEGTLQGHTHKVNCVAYQPDGNIVSASSDGTIRFWDPTTGEYTASLIDMGAEKITSLACSPNGCYVVIGCAQNAIWIWNSTAGVKAAGPFYKHTNSIKAISCSPDGKHFISGGWDQTLRIWDYAGECLADPFCGHESWVSSVAYSPDGNHVVSGSGDNTIRVWDPITGDCVVGPLEGHTNSVHSVAYSPSGDHIASGSKDLTVRIWDAVTGQCVAGPFKGHAEEIYCVSYSPDGTHIISGSEDKTIIIWDANTGHCIGSYKGHMNAVLTVTYSPDGSHIVSGSVDQSIKVWAVQDVISYGKMHQLEDGWIELSDGALFCWIPSWGRHGLYLPTHSLVISSHQTYRLDVSHFLQGESWMLCWK